LKHANPLLTTPVPGVQFKGALLTIAPLVKSGPLLTLKWTGWLVPLTERAALI
jgi:hypothetical protein